MYKNVQYTPDNITAAALIYVIICNGEDNIYKFAYRNASTVICSSLGLFLCAFQYVSHHVLWTVMDSIESFLLKGMFLYYEYEYYNIDFTNGICPKVEANTHIKYIKIRLTLFSHKTYAPV